MDPRFVVPGVHAETPLLRAAPAILAEKADPLFALESRAASGDDIRAVHDMRVASRRLREAMRLLGPLYPRRGFERWFRRVRRVTRALGPVRDSDVFIDSFSRMAGEVPGGGKRAVAFLVGYRTAQRLAELENLRLTLADLRLGERRASFARLACSPCTGPDCLRPLSDLALEAIAARADVVFALVPDALDEAHVPAQHALRIAVKRLRYGVEVLAPCYDDAFDGLHHVLTALQDVLGDLHDVHVFLDMLREPERTAAAGVAGVSEDDLRAVEDYLGERAHRLFGKFVSLVHDRGEAGLRAALLLPLEAGVASSPEPDSETVEAYQP